jgi:hypothetical protein
MKPYLLLLLRSARLIIVIRISRPRKKVQQIILMKILLIIWEVELAKCNRKELLNQRLHSNSLEEQLPQLKLAIKIQLILLLREL